MITGDLNTALVPWVVQYRITDPRMYLFGACELEKTLRDLSESVMREVIGDRTVDEVLTIGRHDIETSALKRLSELSSEYGLGLQTQQVQLATVRPPPVVQAAFNEVNQAQQEKQTAIYQAWAIYNDAVPNAKGIPRSTVRRMRRSFICFVAVSKSLGSGLKKTPRPSYPPTAILGGFSKRSERRSRQPSHPRRSDSTLVRQNGAVTPDQGRKN